MPTVLSVTLALGAYKLAQKGAIVSRLTAIEELAGMTMLCSDKTGTLTLNKVCGWAANPSVFHVFYYYYFFFGGGGGYNYLSKYKKPQFCTLAKSVTPISSLNV
jgi:hypothetical protein